MLLSNLTRLLKFIRLRREQRLLAVGLYVSGVKGVVFSGTNRTAFV